MADLGVFIAQGVSALPDSAVPFVLVFAMVYILLCGLSRFRRRANLASGLIVALIIIIPHHLGLYPGCYDPVSLINDAIPNIGPMLLGVACFVLVIGFFGIGLGFLERYLSYAAVAVIFITCYTFTTRSAQGCSAIWSGLQLPFPELIYLIPLAIILLVVILFGPDKGPGMPTNALPAGKIPAKHKK